MQVGMSLARGRLALSSEAFTYRNRPVDLLPAGESILNMEPIARLIEALPWSVSPPVSAGADMGFDGVFVANGRLNIVEAKFVSSLRPVSRPQGSLNNLAVTVSNYGWKNVQIILSVVFARPEDVG
jgi:hypothetical protein